MADTAYERYKQDEELQKEKEPGKINTVNEVQR